MEKEDDTSLILSFFVLHIQLSRLIAADQRPLSLA
jgi:hypothetical protein